MPEGIKGKHRELVKIKGKYRELVKNPYAGSIKGSKITGPKLSGPVCKKDPKTGESECDLILCEDPKTGQIIVRPRGRCPKGYVEKIAKKMESQDEIIFKVGKSIIVDYDEDQDELVYEGEDEEVEEDEGNEP